MNKIFAENRKARSKYEILEKYEAGIVLTGGEVKSVRAGQISLAEAWVGFEKNELWLKKTTIARYKYNTAREYDPQAPRKLLLHATELEKLANKIAERGWALVPLKFYEVRGRIKVLLGLGRGLTKFDKRQKLRDRDEKRQIERQLKRFI